MSKQGLNDTGVSALVEIARTAGLNLNDRQRREVDRLIADGLVARLAVEPLSGRAKYEVTSKGQGLLDDRGIGANES